MEASQVQIGMPSCLSKYMFVRVRISIFISKIISGIERTLEPDPGSQPISGKEVKFRHTFMYV